MVVEIGNISFRPVLYNGRHFIFHLNSLKDDFADPCILYVPFA